MAFDQHAARKTAPAGPNRAIGPNGETRAIPERVARRVWIAAGGRCTICNKYLADEEFTGQDVMVGQLAHIVGWSSAPGSPRGASDLSSHQRNEADNLMLLCYDQHKVIDEKSLWAMYDVTTLRAMKRRHEARIRKLTAMSEERTTTVLRVVGGIHGQAVDLADTRVTSALFERDRFPDWHLRGFDEYEIDLRAIPGEISGSPGYWSAATELLRDRLGLLRTLVGKSHITHVSVFPLARIPILILLGLLLDDTLPTDIYPKRRDGDEGWGWTLNSPEVDFDVTCVREGHDLQRVAVLLSVSGTVDAGRLPTEIDDRYAVYELTVANEVPAPGLIANTSSLKAFELSWRGLLARIEAKHPGVQSIPVFPAVPAVAAVCMGRHLMRAAHPPLHIYDRVIDCDSYKFMTTTASLI
jgi:hypothetical protein